MPSLIDGAVLGDAVAEQWRSGKLLDLGAKNGLRENELVLSTRKSKKPLIDLGEDANISTEDSLLLGRCVIGKVENVGRWTSTFQLVTDAQYRGRAQLIRETSAGKFVFEAQGILKGDGNSLCELADIPAEKIWCIKVWRRRRPRRNVTGRRSLLFTMQARSLKRLWALTIENGRSSSNPFRCRRLINGASCFDGELARTGVGR